MKRRKRNKLKQIVWSFHTLNELIQLESGHGAAYIKLYEAHMAGPGFPQW